MNPFKKMQDNIKDEEIIQKQRLERLKELENEKHSLGYKMLHRKEMKEKKSEKKQLKEDISDFERRKSNVKSLPILIGFFLVLIVAMVIGTISDRNKETETIAAPTQTVAPTENVPENTVVPTPTPIPTPTVEVSKEPEIQFDGAMLKTDDLKIITQSDYVHYRNDAECLGYGESLTITVLTDVPNVHESDIVCEYDSDYLSVSSEIIDTDDGTFKCCFYITGVQVGESNFKITTAYEKNFLKLSTTSKNIKICKLNSSDGAVVYVTPQGRKYHYSSSCGGDSAAATTYQDALKMGREPCKKCAW